MSLFSTGHDVVDQVGSIHLEGNVIPANWYQIFKMDNGKPDLNGIILLAEIVYWHRPAIVRDEDSGQIVSIKKKFKADLLQRSYQSFSDQFGFSKQQVREALDRLELFGVIKRHFRTIDANNQKYNNVLFIELITPVLFKVTTLSLSKWGGSPSENVDPPHFKEETNTETTTENTTEKKKGGSEQHKAEKQNDYPESFEKFWKAYPVCKRKTKKSESFKTFKKYESDFNLDLLLTILEKLKNSKDWIKDDGDYIPAPQAWLNQRQWENDYWVSQINQNHGGQPAAPTQQSPTQPLINLPSKPKGFLGGSNV